MTELELATEIGINADELGRLRARYLVAGRHFEKKGRAVHYTESGQSELRGMLNLAAVAKKEAAVDVLAPEGVLLRVVKGLPSGRHLRCSDGVRGDLVVDVRCTRNFRPGMELRGTQRPGTDRMFVFYGKLPRKPGRW